MSRWLFWIGWWIVVMVTVGSAIYLDRANKQWCQDKGGDRYLDQHCYKLIEVK